MGRRVTFWSEVKRKRSRSESESEQGAQFQDVDPKLGDLSMVRLKVG